ncbi:hypothetical protein C2G38_416509 [Gigaspora rosea]|uniref:Uncharacterized protein n=1 Tax=Gigaspora rosea TaxID=44941 RepID=A0A397VXN7_9GLOM|nr:hypothetical protein C2G38_416509 [Gigaspora rosea]
MVTMEIFFCSGSDNLKNNSYSCIGLRSQDASVEANFGCKKFKYLSNFYLTLNFGA